MRDVLATLRLACSLAAADFHGTGHKAQWFNGSVQRDKGNFSAELYSVCSSPFF